MDIELINKYLREGKTVKDIRIILGYSEKARYYSIQNLEEGKAYLENKYLYNNLIKICKEL